LVVPYYFESIQTGNILCMRGEGRKNLDFLNLNSQLKGENRLFSFPSEERIKILKDRMEEIQKK